MYAPYTALTCTVHPLKPHFFERYLSALDHISHGVRGPWLRPLTETFNFFLLFLWFRDKPYHYTKFQLPRPFGSAWEFPPTCFSYCSGVLAPPLDINLDF